MMGEIWHKLHLLVLWHIYVCNTVLCTTPEMCGLKKERFLSILTYITRGDWAEIISLYFLIQLHAA